MINFEENDCYDQKNVTNKIFRRLYYLISILVSLLQTQIPTKLLKAFIVFSHEDRKTLENMAKKHFNYIKPAIYVKHP